MILKLIIIQFGTYNETNDQKSQIRESLSEPKIQESFWFLPRPHASASIIFVNILIFGNSLNCAIVSLIQEKLKRIWNQRRESRVRFSEGDFDFATLENWEEWQESICRC